MELYGWNLPLWSALIIILIVLYFTYMTWNFGIFKSMGVPGPWPVPIFGNFLTITKMDMAKADMFWTKQYGKVWRTFNGRFPILLTTDEKMLRELFVKQFNNFTDRQRFEGINGDMEDALLSLTGNHWRNVRHLMSPSFSSGKLKKAADSMLDQMVEDAKVDSQLDMKRFYGILGSPGYFLSVIKRRENTLGNRGWFYGGFTLSVIASTAFGIEVNPHKNPDDPFLKNASKFLSFGSAIFSQVNLVLIFCPFLAKYVGKLGVSMFPKDVQKFFRKAVVDAINERETNRADYVNFLQLMMQAHNADNDSTENRKGMTFNEILANCLLFFFAGYETTASVLSLLSYEVARNSDIQDKIHQEIVEILGDEEPNYDNIQKLTYLDMCISETLRMYPPATRTDRECVQGTTLEGLRIPKGMIVSVPIYAIHHSIEYWEDPETFDPERFSPENKAKHSQFQFIPFGYGPRNCIGMRLALLEAKIVLVKVFRRFRITPSNKTEVTIKQIDQLGLLTPKELWLNVHLRQ